MASAVVSSVQVICASQVEALVDCEMSFGHTASDGASLSVMVTSKEQVAVLPSPSVAV